MMLFPEFMNSHSQVNYPGPLGPLVLLKIGETKSFRFEPSCPKLVSFEHGKGVGGSLF